MIPLCFVGVNGKMREEYDFSEGRKNPHVKKKQITINLDEGVIRYFKELAEETGMPYQILINLYLTDCAKRKLKPDFTWTA